jgi:dihydrofolate synthase / folylpolyglutamate synthase
MPDPDPDAALLAWLDSAQNREVTGRFDDLKLDAVRRVLDRLPTPPAPITVAGTKGKGSTVRLIECGMRAAGQRTLAFTSPHVRHVRERWREDGVPISAARAADLARRAADAESRAGVSLTWFERTCVMAWIAATDRPDTALLCEVGIGGRLDCTNALDARLAVITPLSADHRQVLGPTLTHIAREKAGIARPGRPVVIAPQSPEAAIALWRQLPTRAVAHWVQPGGAPAPGALIGAHQAINAATAWAVLRLVLPACDAATIQRGWADAALAARCQIIDTGARRILVDAAHNGASIAATMAVAQQALRPGWTLLVALATDKEVDDVLAAIPAGVRAHRCGYASTRARGATAWPAPAQAWPWHAHVADAYEAIDPHADLCITGSFYLAGEALALLAPRDALPG